MSKVVDIFDGILFVRTRHFEEVKKVVVLQGNKPEKRFFDKKPNDESFEWCTGCKEYDQEQHCCHRFTKLIRDTVEEMKEYERPKGKWIHYEQIEGLGGFWKCSCCGKPAIFTPILAINNCQNYCWTNSKTNFCPNCGADMRGDA